MISRVFTTLSVMFTAVIVSSLSTKEIPNLQSFFLSEIPFAKPVLQCIRTANPKITVAHDKNTVVRSDNQKSKLVLAIIRIGTTVRKTEAVRNTLPFPMTTDLLLTEAPLNSNQFTICGQKLNDTIQGLNQQDRSVCGFATAIQPKILILSLISLFLQLLWLLLSLNPILLTEALKTANALLSLTAF